MTLIEILHTHPFALGVAVGMCLAFGSFILCTAFLYALQRIRDMSRSNAKAVLGNHPQPLFSSPTVGTPDSRSA
jgi:MFS superfamily sulfate permease-like transporter